MVDGMPIPEDRSVRRFDGDDYLGSGVQGMYNAVNSIYGGDALLVRFLRHSSLILMPRRY